MMDCQLTHYLADIALSVRWVALYGVLLGSFGVIFSLMPVTLPKWVRIISIVAIIISTVLLIFVPSPNTILFGC